MFEWLSCRAVMIYDSIGGTLYHLRGYFDASSCAGGGSSAVFTLTTPSNCVTTGGTYPTYTYEKWTACSYGYITVVTQYTGDAYCGNLVQTGTKSVSSALYINFCMLC